MMKKSKFPVFLLGYVVIFLAAIAVGLSFLWKYLQAYERSLPTGVISAYEEQSLHNDYNNALTKYSEAHSSAFESASRVAEWMRAHMDESTLRIKRSSGGTDLDYTLRIGNQNVGSLELTVDGPQRFGLGECRIANTSWELPEGMAATYQVTAPQGAEILVNGAQLSESNCEVIMVPLENDLLTAELDAPPLICYSFSCFDKPEVRLNGGGSVIYSLHPLTDTTWNVSAACNDADTQKYQVYAEEFVKRYVDYSAGRLYVTQLTPYLVEGSILHDRVVQAAGTMVFVKTGNYKLSNLKFDSFEPCGNAVICKGSYNITDDFRHSDVDINLEILIVEENGILKVLNYVMS